MENKEMELLGVKMSYEELDRLMVAQSSGKLLKVENGKVIAYDYVPTEEDILAELRHRREIECFAVINRGQLWYDTLTEEQKTELQKWYQDWLDVTDTKTEPKKPKWLK